MKSNIKSLNNLNFYEKQAVIKKDIMKMFKESVDITLDK
ncbi:hypothetical protein IYC_16463 [Clostridium sporogenes PA 3679]|nr:hypothetical protein IYC_16463 [Clostridium sporogenes PA 3679]